MQAQTQTSQRLEPFRKSLLRRDKYNQKQNQEHHNYQRQHCWISHKSASSGFVCVGNFLPNPLLCVTLVNLIEISTDRKHLLRSAPFRLRCQQTVNIFIPLFSSGVILTDHLNFYVSRFQTWIQYTGYFTVYSIQGDILQFQVYCSAGFLQHRANRRKEYRVIFRFTPVISGMSLQL